MHSILALVRSGIGLALVPEAAMNLHARGVALRHVEQQGPRRVELYLAWRRDNPNPLLPIISDMALALTTAG